MSSQGTRLKQADAAQDGRRIMRDTVGRDRSQAEDYSAPFRIALAIPVTVGSSAAERQQLGAGGDSLRITRHSGSKLQRTESLLPSLADPSGYLG